MCLAIPGKIVEVTDEGETTRHGIVDFGGISKPVNLAFAPEAGVGDYVLIHVGFAIGMIDEEKARAVFSTLREMEALDVRAPASG